MRILKFLSISGAGLVLLTASVSADEINLEPVEKWVARQSKAKTMEVDFVQERKLRTVGRALKNSGKIWYEAPGSFRWQLGEPPKSVVVQKSKGDLYSLKPQKKTAEVKTYAQIQGKKSGDGAAFLEAGFPKSVDEFQKSFKVTGIREKDGLFEVSAKLTARKASLGVRKVIFFIDGTHRLKALRLFFRDGSQVTNSFGTVKENGKIPAGTFEVDLEGYKVKRKA